jgi:pyruvate dehydrogenase (quinone)/pyruvate oxidase
MAYTAADILCDTLCDWGVEVVFGLPGDGINGLMEALRRRQDRLRFIQVRHEEAAAFMACGYAKYTGKLGVCLATSGPGGLHLLTGLYDAKLDGQPVLAITGHHYHDLIDTHAQQDVSLDRVFADVSVYNTRIMGPAHVEPASNLACRTALSRRGSLFGVRAHGGFAGGGGAASRRRGAQRRAEGGHPGGARRPACHR